MLHKIYVNGSVTNTQLMHSSPTYLFLKAKSCIGGDSETAYFVGTRFTFNIVVTRGPALHAFWDLEKTVLHETRVSGTDCTVVPY